MDEKNLVSKSTPSTFSKSQDGGIKALINFINSDEYLFTLHGAAGTGKTYLLDYFLNEVYTKSSCVSAPTHKAVRVVEDRVHKKGLTLHSLHGLKLNTDLYNFDINNPQFDPLAEPKMPNYSLVIIDECSMINAALAGLTAKRAKLYGVKVIFVGDSYQLPPIRERKSVVFKYPNYELTEIIRQKNDNPLLDVLTLLREDIMGDTSKAINYLYKNQAKLNDKKEGHVILNENQFEEFMLSRFLLNKFNNKFISWTNECVSDYNHSIRRHLSSTDESLMLQDLVMAHKTIVDEFLTPIIVNSEEYSLSSIEKDVNDYNFEVFYSRFANRYDLKTTSILQVVDHKASTYANFITLLKLKYHDYYIADYKRKRKLLDEFFAFKNQHLTMTDIEFNVDGKNVFLGKDITYGYGITVHKAQGSTYENVYLDLRNITHSKTGWEIQNTRNNPYAMEMRNKLLYVSLSRASKSVYIKA